MDDFLRIFGSTHVLRRPGSLSGHLLRSTVALLLALTMVPFLPAIALAHGALERAIPGDGDHLSVAPRELRLTFTEDVELGLTRLVLSGPEGAVSLAPLALDPDSANVLIGAIERSLVAGAYTVEWQVVGEDGHPVRGEYSFNIAPDAAGLAMTAPPAAGPTAAATQATPAGTRETDSAEETGSGALLWIIALLGLGSLGLIAFKLLSRPPANEEHV